MYEINITKAVRDDIPVIFELMKGLAEFEELLDTFYATEELLEQAVFSDNPAVEVLVGRLDGEIKGYALFFHNFSSFLGRPGMYLEDIYVEPDSRGSGLGKQLLVEVARIAKERGCHRLEWLVLDWNEKAIRFYDSLGAKPLNGCTVYRMDQDAITTLIND